MGRKERKTSSSEITGNIFMSRALAELMLWWV
jgi:hypothetical protein